MVATGNTPGRDSPAWAELAGAPAYPINRQAIITRDLFRSTTPATQGPTGLISTSSHRPQGPDRHLHGMAPRQIKGREAGLNPRANTEKGIKTRHHPLGLKRL